MAFFDSILAQISENYIKFASCVSYITMDEIRKINRLKAVLAEKGKTAKELALDLNVSPVTVSRWSQNVIQPDLQTLTKIADSWGLIREIYSMPTRMVACTLFRNLKPSSLLH